MPPSSFFSTHQTVSFHLEISFSRRELEVNMGPSTTRSIGLWTWEIASLVASIAQFVAMIAILISFDGKEIFDGPLVTLNTVVSILALGSKASLLTLVANCISQANWSLFSGPPRRLYDFEIVADASRGPLGSLRLLISRSFKGG
jgi:hypothetical protein